MRKVTWTQSLLLGLITGLVFTAVYLSVEHRPPTPSGELTRARQQLLMVLAERQVRL